MLKRLVITGYKPHELGIFQDKHPGIPIIKKAMENKITQLVETGLEWVLVSGQPGVETWAIEVVLDLQQTYPQLQYAIMPPFLEQEKNWNEARKTAYEEIVMHADYFAVLTNRPYEGSWQFIERDKFLLRNSDGILFVYDEENEGSPKYMKKMAEQFSLQFPYAIHVINAFDLQLIAEDLQREEWE